MRNALSGLLLFTASTLAYAGDSETEARLSWEMSFGGGHSLDTGYSLALGYREYRDFQAHGPLLELAKVDVTGEATVASLAGVPVLAPRAGSQLDDIAYSSSPIYWVWWVATGAVIAVWAINADDDDGAAPVGTGSGGG